MTSVQGGKTVWCLLSTVAKLSVVFCPQWQKGVVSFVHPGKNAWCLLGLVAFVWHPAGTSPAMKEFEYIGTLWLHIACKYGSLETCPLFVVHV